MRRCFIVLLCLIPGSAIAGPLCDALASKALACTHLNINQVSVCIRNQPQLMAACKTETGSGAISVALQPAYTAYLKMRADEHTRIYGK